MKSFVHQTGKAVVLDQHNVDTDQIIPKQFLKRIERTGYGQFLFYDQRYEDGGSPNPDFLLNQPDAAGASILIAGRNFGCGSSREHAVWALMDFGFRAVIAPSFADIFAGNAFQNGLLTIPLPDADIARLRGHECQSVIQDVRVNLETQTIHMGDHFIANFSMDPFRRDCLMRGLDEIGRTLLHAEDISRYEAGRPHWTAPLSSS